MPSQTLTAFVAMSFREEEEPSLVDYFKAMERAASSTRLPINVTKMDLEEGDYEISQKIMEKIDEADIVIADFTLSSRNVYFELGYARGVKRRVIQTARKGTSMEFDIRNWRTIFYRNAAELEEKLGAALKSAYVDLTEGKGQQSN
jgi:nucleoside 2-deoxyribosyltransferase